MMARFWREVRVIWIETSVLVSHRYGFLRCSWIPWYQFGGERRLGEYDHCFGLELDFIASTRQHEIWAWKMACPSSRCQCVEVLDSDSANVFSSQLTPAVFHVFPTKHTRLAIVQSFLMHIERINFWKSMSRSWSSIDGSSYEWNWPVFVLFSVEDDWNWPNKISFSRTRKLEK